MALTAKKPETVRKDIPVELIEDGKTKRLTFDLPANVHQHWKMESVKRGMTLKDIITVSVSEYLAREQ